MRPYIAQSQTNIGITAAAPLAGITSNTRVPILQAWYTCSEGHSAKVNSVAFSSDGNMVASVSSDNTVRLWDTATGAARHTLQGHSANINSVAYSPDGDMVASASNDKTIRLWDAVTGMALRTIKVGVVAEFLSFSISGQYLNTDRGSFRLKSSGNSLNSTDLLQVMSVLKEWVMEDKKNIPWLVMARQTLEGHLGRVKSVAFSPDGNMVASSSNDNTVRLWDAVTGAALRTIEVGVVVESLSFSSSGQYLNTDRASFRLSSFTLNSTDLSGDTSVTKEWVTEDGKNILWLPPDFSG